MSKPLIKDHGALGSSEKEDRYRTSQDDDREEHQPGVTAAEIVQPSGYRSSEWDITDGDIDVMTIRLHRAHPEGDSTVPRRRKTLMHSVSCAEKKSMEKHT